MWRVLALSFTLGYAAHTEPVNLHAVNAAEAAEVAKQAATVAKRVAAHTEDVAHDTAAALRFTRDALERAGANADDVAEVGKQADQLEAEAGTKSSESSEKSQRDASSTQGEESDKSSSEEKSSKLEKGSSNHINRDSSSSSSSSSSSGSSSSGSSSGSSSSSSGGRSLDVNSDIVPYPNGVEPFGQEAPAKELTEESVKQSDGMVKQIENAQGVEAKRSVYRALTKLRGATIASYDGIAKGHLKNVDHYNKGHKWREDHPMRHLAEEEADTHIWAFPKHSSKTAPRAVKKKEKKVSAGAKQAAKQAAPPAAAPAAAGAPAAAK